MKTTSKDTQHCIPIEKKSSISISIEDTSNLIETITFLFLQGGKEIDKQVTTKVYPLRMVTEDELFQLRLSQKPGFVLKKGGNYYYTKIRKGMKFANIVIAKKHRCAVERDICKRFSALPDCDGGCQKIRDLSVEAHLRNRELSIEDYLGTSELKDAVALSKRIEKYDFITEGFESFNTSQEALVVFKCNHYASSIY